MNFSGISYIQAQLDSLAVVALGKDTKGADAVHKCLQATNMVRKDNSFCDILLVGFMIVACARLMQTPVTTWHVNILMRVMRCIARMQGSVQQSMQCLVLHSTYL